MSTRTSPSQQLVLSERSLVHLWKTRFLVWEFCITTPLLFWKQMGYRGTRHPLQLSTAGKGKPRRCRPAEACSPRATARRVLTESVKELSGGRRTGFPRKLLSWEAERGPSTVPGGGLATVGPSKAELGDGGTGGKCGEEEEVGGRKGWAEAWW